MPAHHSGAGPGVLLDPLAVPESVEGVTEIVLTNRHHRRDALEAHERFGAPVRVPEVGLHEFGGADPVDGYRPGDELAGGAIVVHEVGVLSPDEMALHLPTLSALALADTVIRYGEELEFVPDALMDEPEETKRGLREALGRLAGRLEFDHLLLAHGSPRTGSARERLSAFAAGRP